MNFELLLLLGALPALLLVQIYLLGVKMSEPEQMMRPMPNGLAPHEQAVIARYREWVASVGLEFRTAFQFGTIRAAVFQQKDQPRFFSFLFHKQLTCSAESYLEDLTELDTSNSGSLGLFPRPGAYAQSFPGISPQELWQRHLEGETYLAERFGYRWVPLNRSYQQLAVNAMRIRMNFNRSQFLWPARVLWRYFTTRHRIRNRTVMQQFP